MLNPSQKRNLPMVVFCFERIPVAVAVESCGIGIFLFGDQLISCPAGTNSPVVHELKSAQASENTALWELSLRVAAVDPDAH